MRINGILCAVAVAGVFAVEVNMAEGGNGGKGGKPGITIKRPDAPANSASPSAHSGSMYQQANIGEAIATANKSNRDHICFIKRSFTEPRVMQSLMELFMDPRGFKGLEFVDCEIDKRNMEDLLEGLKNPSLSVETLWIINTPIVIEALSDALKTNKSLNWLGFGPRDITIEGLIALSAKNPEIWLCRHLEGSGIIQLRQSGADMFICEVKENRTIRSVLGQTVSSAKESDCLCFVDCTISEEMIPFLNRFRSKSIDFQRCLIADEVLRKLSRELQTDKLWLTRGTINERNLPIVSEALKENKTVKLLSLERNNLNCEHIRSLSDALKENTSLETLNVSVNDLRKPGVMTLCKGIKENTTLKTLIAYDVSVTKEEMREALGELSTRKVQLCVYWERPQDNLWERNSTETLKNWEKCGKLPQCFPFFVGGEPEEK